MARHQRLGRIARAPRPQLVLLLVVVRLVAPHEPDDLLVGEWPLDGTRLDAAGEARISTTGDIRGTAADTWKQGHFVQFAVPPSQREG